MKIETITNVILPIAQEIGTAVIGLSTPQGFMTPQAVLFSAKDGEGKSVFKQVRLGQPCKACKMSGSLCIHEEAATAEGLSDTKRQRIQYLYGSDKYLFRREFMAETGDSGCRLFTESVLTQFASRAHVDLPTKPIDFLMMSIDPAQGGSCEWGITIAYYDVELDAQIIVLLDSRKLEGNTSPDAIKHYIASSILKVRSLCEAFAIAPIVIACEAGPTIMASNLALQVREMQNSGICRNIHVMVRCNGKPGVPKNSSNTTEIIYTSHALMDQNRVYLSKAVCTSSFDVKVDTVITKFFQQLGYINITDYVLNGEPRCKLVTDHRNNDLYMSWSMNFYWYLEFVVSTRPEEMEIKRGYLIRTRGMFVGTCPKNKLAISFGERESDPPVRENPNIRPELRAPKKRSIFSISEL